MKSACINNEIFISLVGYTLYTCHEINQCNRIFTLNYEGLTEHANKLRAKKIVFSLFFLYGCKAPDKADLDANHYAIIYSIFMYYFKSADLYY